MTIGVLAEPDFDSRVSVLPESISPLIKKGIQVLIETNAGSAAFANDGDYSKSGAVVKPAEEVAASSDIILSINRPQPSLIGRRSSTILIGVYQPLHNPGFIRDWAKQSLTVFSLDMLPRTTRAQSMDVLSSQANIAGYKAVLLAADRYPRYFPMFMTAAGSIPPAKVLVLGAGVAGLQAIATARRLGAVVEVFDTRPAVKEEVKSLGGKFIEVDGAADASKAGGYAVEQSEEFKHKQQSKIAESISKADVVIATAQIPGKKAPVLVTKDMASAMKKGSLIVDLAAATGGNTELTKNNETVDFNGVRIIGDSLLASSMPYDASKMYGKNVLNFLQLIIDKEGKLNLNFEDELVKGACMAHNGEVTNEKLKSL
ncbi:MAG: Re/Si-specific NAD(P)(+) transhydrogenase subunit alpha [Bacteroidetes bacterium]|nr:Re/Si-specific NAD(P)(+) transhydrogenase subunit alpha [Bacteroidota bacterium]